MVTVYILQSLKNYRYYTGQTKDISQRIVEHNNGNNSSTRSGIPWKVIWTCTFPNRAEAINMESKIKSRGAKRFLQDNNKK